MSEFNISIPGGESKRLLTGGKYCPEDILVTAEGGGNVIDETLTIAASCTDADSVYNLLSALAPENYRFAEFEWLGEHSSADNNQLIFATLYTTIPVTGYTGRMTFCRLRNSAYNFGSESSPAYDIILKAGDTVRMVAAL